MSEPTESNNLANTEDAGLPAGSVGSMGSSPAASNSSPTSPATTTLNPLRLARAKNQLTLRELATMSGVSAMTISFLENGDRLARFNTLYRLAEVLAVPFESLLPLLDPTPATRGKKGGTARARRFAEAVAEAEVTPGLSALAPDAENSTNSPAQSRKLATGNPKNRRPAMRNYWLLVYDSTSDTTQAHGPLLEVSARQLAAAIGQTAPCRVYQAASEQVAQELHLAWLTSLTRTGQFDHWLNWRLQG